MLRPMLACEWDRSYVTFPIYAQPKTDGVRMLCNKGEALSRSGKPINNWIIRETVRDLDLHGFDGELFCQDYRTTQSIANSTSDLLQRMVYRVFDIWDSTLEYKLRQQVLAHTVLEGFCELVPAVELNSFAAVYSYHDQCVANGYEGIVLRSPGTIYKHGRSTKSYCELMRFKDYVDTEARVVEVLPAQKNENPPQVDELGYTKRSSHQENKVDEEKVGALRCEGFYSNGTPYTVKIGTFKGVTHYDRQLWWQYRDELIGKIAKFRYVQHGMKDAPRHPVFLGWRSENDL